MFEIFEIIGLCGFLGYKTLAEKARVHRMNVEDNKHKYDKNLQWKIRDRIQIHGELSDGTKIPYWNKWNDISVAYLVKQELAKLGYELAPNSWETRYDFSKYDFKPDGSYKLKK